jgi:selenocysteine lyase/cysteine desulfurase
MNEQIRALFPITQKYIYLNHAAVGPLSTRSVQAIQKFLEEASQEGGLKWMEWVQEINRTRAQAARLIKAKPHEIAFMRNTSDGLSAMANGLDWRPGDNVVSCNCEFPSNIYPWMRLEKYGVQLRLAPERNGRIETDELLSLVDERTRVVTVSFVQFINGFCMNLPTIGRFCRERDIMFVVDAIQGLGALSLDVQRDYVDALSADAHKFLLGPEGATIHGLGAALDLFLEIGIERIEPHVLALTDQLAKGLQAKGYNVISSRRPGEASAIVCCTHDRFSAAELCQRLAEHRIIVAHRLGRLRISPHFYNTREEIDALLEKLP